MIDVERTRLETPSSRTHIHFNNAGSSPMPEPVKQAFVSHVELETQIGGYAAADREEAKLEEFYTAFAQLLNCQPGEIAYAENATRAWDMIFYSIDFKPGDRILTCQSEYASNYLAFLHVAQTKGVEIDVAPDDQSGQVSVAGMEALITPRTRLIAISHIPTQGGLVNPAAEVGKLAKVHEVLYLLDACQSVGQLELDVQAIGCDFLTGTGRKFLRGPRGTGFLYANLERLLELHPPFIDGQAANWVAVNRYELVPNARRFENWERNVAGQIGLAAAVRYAMALGLGAIEARVTALAARLRRQLGAIPGVEVADLGVNKCGIVTWRKAGEAPAQTAERLAANNIMCSVSRVGWARLDFERRGLEALVRTSVHYFNTEAEIDRVCELVEGTV